jgi:hypothetical protein
MNRVSVFRLAAVLVSGLGLNGCGVTIQNDGHMFQRMAEQVSAIPVDDGGGALTVATGASDATPPSRPPLEVKVVEALDLPQARDAGLRGVIGAVAQHALQQSATAGPDMPKASAAGLRGAIKAAGPLLQLASAPAQRPGKAVQLAAFPSEQAAHTAWASLQAKNPALLGRLTPQFQKVDLGSKGTWVRIKAGPVASAATAERICAAAGVQGRWCASAFAAPQA